MRYMSGTHAQSLVSHIYLLDQEDEAEIFPRSSLY